MAAANDPSQSQESARQAMPMADEETCAAATGDNVRHGNPQPGIIEQVKQTVDDSKEWIESELAFHKVRLREGSQRAKSIGLFIGIGAALFVCSFTTLLLGIFLTVTYYFGPIVAVITVPAAYAIFGYLALRAALAKIHQLKTMVQQTGGITGMKASDAGDGMDDTLTTEDIQP
ncbi:phage holin family protein [Parasphingorhabdus sp. DH2-15]|uniref:phage holin family protein n=1 Tax=Parasphingorhabdus sp. DH2-15 TaxID=3444112 RepID=UPI003F688F73